MVSDRAFIFHTYIPCSKIKVEVICQGQSVVKCKGRISQRKEGPLQGN